jgi:hypothetical protein
VGETSSDFRDTLLELIDRSHQEPADHPSPDQWLAYQRGELPAGEEEHLQEHLVRCRDCFDLAAGAAAFAQPDEDGEEVETAAVWRLVRPQSDPPSQKVQSIRRPSRGFRLPMGLAASFFVALVGLTAWNLQLRSDLAAVRAPRANVPIFEIVPVERDSAGRELTMPAGPRMLVIHPAEDLPAYRLAIRDAASGRELLSHELRPNQDLALTLYLPDGLPPGRYRLEIADGAGKVLETHLLRVTGD